MQVLHREHHGTEGAQPVDQPEQPLDLRHHRIARGHPHAQRRPASGARGLAGLGRVRPVGRLERLQHHRQRQTLRQFVAVGPQHGAAERLGLGEPAFEQRGLADPGLALDEHRRAAPRRGQRDRATRPAHADGSCSLSHESRREATAIRTHLRSAASASRVPDRPDRLRDRQHPVHPSRQVTRGIGLRGSGAAADRWRARWSPDARGGRQLARAGPRQHLLRAAAPSRSTPRRSPPHPPPPPRPRPWPRRRT